MGSCSGSSSSEPSSSDALSSTSTPDSSSEAPSDPDEATVSADLGATFAAFYSMLLFSV